MGVQSLGREYPLEEEMATHSNILAWIIPWTQEPGALQSTGHKESDKTELTCKPFHIMASLINLILPDCQGYGFSCGHVWM